MWDVNHDNNYLLFYLNYCAALTMWDVNATVTKTHALNIPCCLNYVGCKYNTRWQECPFGNSAALTMWDVNEMWRT